jgi:hypothetical protein
MEDNNKKRTESQRGLKAILLTTATVTFLSGFCIGFSIGHSKGLKDTLEMYRRELKSIIQKQSEKDTQSYKRYSINSVEYWPAEESRIIDYNEPNSI